jgi:hypothetical protein
MTDSEKLSKSKRQQLVAQCLIDRLTEVETQKYIYDHTNNQVSISTIERDIRRISEQATKFFYLLAKDNHEYNSKLKITIDSLESMLSDLRKEYNKATNIFAKLKIADSMLRYEKEVYEYYKFLPALHEIVPNTEPEPSAESAQASTQSTEDLYGCEVEPWDMNNWIQCPQCKRFFKEQKIKLHDCPIV